MNTGLYRDTSEKFYTNHSVVKICMEYIRANLVIDPEDIIIEPSAGNGAFLEEIEGMTEHTFFYDIEPEHPKISQADFLEVDLDVLRDFVDYRKIHFIGNPPFGRQSSMAFTFIKKCVKYADSISFILPKSFKKESMQRHFPKYFHLVFETDLLENAFLVGGKVHDVPCVFQIWEKKEVERDVLARLEPAGFVFVKKIGEEGFSEPEISFRRVGVNAGTIDTEWREKSEQSHYFIRFTNGADLLENIRRVKNAAFLFNNTVGPKSISKQELIREWKKCLHP